MVRGKIGWMEFNGIFWKGVCFLDFMWKRFRECFGGEGFYLFGRGVILLVLVSFILRLFRELYL